MACIAKLGEAVLVEPGASGEAVGQTGEGALQKLHQALVRRRERRSECDAQEVERSRERDDIDVGDGDDPLLLDDDERVRVRRVQLDSELGAHEFEGVPQRPEDLRETAERERVLEIARRPQ